MEGPDSEAAPYLLRSHSEIGGGVVPEIQYRVGQSVTRTKLINLDTLLVSTGTIREVPEKSNRACRTQIVTEVGNASKMVRNWGGGVLEGDMMTLLHRVVYYGDQRQNLQQLADLMRLKVVEEGLNRATTWDTTLSDAGLLFPRTDDQMQGGCICRPPRKDHHHIPQGAHRMSSNARCPDCHRQPELDRRKFLKSTAAGVVLPVVAGGATRLYAQDPAFKYPAASGETLVAQLYESLNEEQHALCTHEFDHPLRLKVDANWLINDSRVGKSFSPDQQKLIEEIFLSLHDPEYASRVMEQVQHDGGFHNCSVALFGQPGTGKFEFVLTGRHVTRRCDGDSVQGAAFGGPIFYGHAAKSFNEPPDHEGNVYWYQAQRANELFQALDGRQRNVALLDTARPEQGTDTVKLSGSGGDFPGLPFGDLSADQRVLARQVMDDCLAPFRKVDRAESLKLIDANGFADLHISYYRNHDIGDDGVWDVWMLEGPSMVWYFRGSPHVHTWVHIRDSA